MMNRNQPMNSVQYLPSNNYWVTQPNQIMGSPMRSFNDNNRKFDQNTKSNQQQAFLPLSNSILRSNSFVPRMNAKKNNGNNNYSMNIERPFGVVDRIDLGYPDQSSNRETSKYHDYRNPCLRQQSLLDNSVYNMNSGSRNENNKNNKMGARLNCTEEVSSRVSYNTLGSSASHLTTPSQRKKKSEMKSEEFVEEIVSDGGIETFKELAVLNNDQEIGFWSGFTWRAKKLPGVSKIAYDREGTLWYVTTENEIGNFQNQDSKKNLGHLGNESIIDIAFDNDNKLWAINQTGELCMWDFYEWKKRSFQGFHKLKAISFDRDGFLWAINTSCEIAVWNDEEGVWNQKEVSKGVKVSTIEFDKKNRLWVLGMNGQLMLLSGNQWVNFGWVGCWKFKDLSFNIVD